MQLYNLIMNYLSQSSTYKGIFTILAACGIIVSPDLSNAIIALALAVIGLIDVIVDERAGEKIQKLK